MIHRHFEPGEVAIFVASNPAYAHLNGQDVTVDSGLLPCRCLDCAASSSPDMGYRITSQAGNGYFVRPRNLRKKPKPPAPREAVGEWSECMRRPEREGVA